MSVIGGKAGMTRPGPVSANDPKRTFVGTVYWLLPHSLARRLELPFEHCDPVAQLNGLEFRVHGSGKAGKAREHRTFVFIEISAYGMRTIERQGKTANRIRRRHPENGLRVQAGNRSHCHPARARKARQWTRARAWAAGD